MDEEILKITTQLLRLQGRGYTVSFEYGGVSGWFSIRILKGSGKTPKKVFEDSIHTRRRIWCRKLLTNLTPDPFEFVNFLAYLRQLENRHPVFVFDPSTDYTYTSKNNKNGNDE